MYTSVSKYDFMEAFCDMDRYEQSLAEYRNKVIEDCAVKADALANCEENTDGYRNGAAWCAEAIRAMKEQL
jgi:hypothetical protein